jgi:hypothetical protein
VGGRFEEAEDGELTLVASGGDFRFYGPIAGSPIEDGSGFIRGRHALATLVRNRWFEIEGSVAELRPPRRKRPETQSIRRLIS